MDFIDEKIESYVHDHTQDEGELLARLVKETYESLEIPHMLSGRSQGRLLKMMAQLLGAKNIVEVGTFSGYSALSMAEALPDGGRLFTANLSDLRATYQFSARSFLRFTMQYVDSERNKDLYNFPVQSDFKELTTQLLYSYKLNAATRFFIGYSDEGFQNDAYDSIEPTNRTIFAKFSYAWQP